MKKRGFTLIELMVVIAIIGLLSAVVLASLNNAKTKGVNARIQSDIHQYHDALELYYSKHGSYPVPADASFYCLGVYPSDSCWSNGKGKDTALNSALGETIPSLPPGQTVTDSGGTAYIGYIYQCEVKAAVCTGKGYTIEWVLNGAGLSCNEQGQALAGITNGVTGCKLVVSS